MKNTTPIHDFYRITLESKSQTYQKFPELEFCLLTFVKTATHSAPFDAIGLASQGIFPLPATPSLIEMGSGSLLIPLSSK